MFMAIIGFILSLVAGGFMLIGLIPFLGWTNWFTTLPLAIGAAVLSGLGLNRKSHLSVVGIAGLIISLLVFFIGVARLFVGCGIF
jgi:hypothetical protein